MYMRILIILLLISIGNNFAQDKAQNYNPSSRLFIDLGAGILVIPVECKSNDPSFYCSAGYNFIRNLGLLIEIGYSPGFGKSNWVVPDHPEATIDKPNTTTFNLNLNIQMKSSSKTSIFGTIGVGKLDRPTSYRTIKEVNQTFTGKCPGFGKVTGFNFGGGLIIRPFANSILLRPDLRIFIVPSKTTTTTESGPGWRMTYAETRDGFLLYRFALAIHFNL